MKIVSCHFCQKSPNTEKNKKNEKKTLEDNDMRLIGMRSRALEDEDVRPCMMRTCSREDEDMWPHVHKEKKLWRTRMCSLGRTSSSSMDVPLNIFSFFLIFSVQGQFSLKCPNTILIFLPKFSFEINLIFSDWIPLPPPPPKKKKKLKKKISIILPKVYVMCEPLCGSTSSPCRRHACFLKCPPQSPHLPK